MRGERGWERAREAGRWRRWRRRRTTTRSWSEGGESLGQLPPG